MRLHFGRRLSATSPDGRHVYMLGARIGYWPCLRAPFIQVSLGKYMFDFWYGMPSYKGGQS